jgi:hypothetical protein
MLRLLSIAAAYSCCLAYAHGQVPVTTFAGKTITLYIGNSIGGGYDLYGRT